MAAHAYDVVANFLLERTRHRPAVGIICGSGLSGLSSAMTDTETIHYEDIPGFPQATVAGHAGELVFGKIGDVDVVCMRGRFHFYEGNNMDKVVLPVRVMRLIGVKLLVVTNAAGGLNPAYEVGDIVVIQDHFGVPCMAGYTPLRGPNDDDLGPRFPAMSDAYDPALQQMVVDAAEALKITHKVRQNGTYCFVSGPTYETRAESRWLRTVGDTVGMSTVPEVIAAKHCGMKVLGLSLVTNKVIIDAHETQHANHQEVLEATKFAGKDVENVVKMVVASAALKEYLHHIPVLSYPSSFLKKLAGEPVSAPESIKPEERGPVEGSCCRCHCQSKCGHGSWCVALTVAAVVAGIVVYMKHH